MNQTLLELLALMRETEYQTSQKLSKKLKLSEKTVRNRIRELNEELAEHGARIDGKTGGGYCLVVENREVFQEFLKESQGRGYAENVPGRVAELLNILLMQNEFLKVEDLCETLYISERTLSRDLREAERILQRYNLKLEKRPYHGTRIVGLERDRRRCAAEECKGIKNVQAISRQDQIRECVKDILDQEDYHISDIAFDNLVNHIEIAIARIDQGRYVEFFYDEERGLIHERDLGRAVRCAEAIREVCGICFPEEEILYLAIHLAGKEIHEPASQGNLVIDEQVRETVREMLEVVYEAFKVDFRDDLELIMALGQHLVPLRVRLAFHMKLQNPILEEIKENYGLEYAMAAQASTVITKHYHEMLEDDELGYLALAFALSLERKRTENAKKSILLVCASGKGSARLYEYQFKKVFGNYIKSIKTCTVEDLKRVQMQDIDYIFTTVPIDFPVPVPIQKLDGFLKGGEIQKVRNWLNAYEDVDIKKFFWPDLFFKDVELDTREEILQYMCARAAQCRKVPEDFLEAVMLREQLAQTEFGNMVALPHPNQAMTEDTFVCVCILKRPVIWYKKPVQVVFLVSISTKHTGEYLQNLYGALSRLILDEDMVKHLIKQKSFSGLLKQLDSN